MFSRLAGFSERAIADWEGGKPVSGPVLRRIKELDRFRDRLSEVVAADAIPIWLDTPNPAFDGLKPLEVKPGPKSSNPHLRARSEHRR
jgi:hypothetical protein